MPVNPEPPNADEPEFVKWFRSSSPYIHAHRNQTFVIFFSDSLIANDFASFIHDIALLKSLGIRLILVHGIRHHIDQYLQQSAIKPVFHKNNRVTPAEILPLIKASAGQVRLETEALLSMGLPNSPMAGARIKVSSGNYVTAQPKGVIDGIDFGYTGIVRRIDTVSIKQQLEQDNIVLISPIGFSVTGEIFNLNAEQVATEVAVAMCAKKMILLTEEHCQQGAHTIKQLTTSEAEAFVDAQQLEDSITRSLKAAIDCTRRGVARVHLINQHTDGAVLLELFSRDGIGTLISANSFERIRPASIDDIGGILELITPLEKQGILVKRSREKLEMDLTDYIVIERDGLILGCTALHCLENGAAEIACLAIHPEYRGEHRGRQLLDFLINLARKKAIHKLYALSSQTMHWFIEQGFEQGEINSLPDALKIFYNYQRSSKIFYREI